jgi:(E)-4-hydroxy-3-methyl-but-2-enyl pyrophosphate reductase
MRSIHVFISGGSNVGGARPSCPGPSIEVSTPRTAAGAFASSQLRTSRRNESRSAIADMETPPAPCGRRGRVQDSQGPGHARRATIRAVEVVLANPRGFCAGVDRAIEIVEVALARFGPPIYVRHEIVHNQYVVDDLRAKGACSSTTPRRARGRALIYSAHGVSPAVREAARARGLRTIDGTCPLVTKVHVETMRMLNDGYDVVLVGHAGHVEVEGTMGHAPDRIHLVQTVEDVAALEVRDPDKLGCVTQTTLSVDDTREVIEALSRASRTSACRARTTSAMRRRTARTR